MPKIRTIDGIVPRVTPKMLYETLLLPGDDNSLCLYLGKVFINV